ncbi:hypothetical protein QBC44DRAFT_329139 [Cladorrhinum sp. PSN332]|nr:hypothetical protein QBC44DRAFT_329139 [Cladorrhinum sp. PSN332]
MAPSQQQQWSLTNHLLSTNSSLFTSATQHPFLLAAAHGTLPKETLSRWLANDRLYIHSYIRAAGKLLESIELPIELHLSETDNFETQLVDWLIEALVAVRREERMFLDVAERYGLSLGLGSSEIKTAGEAGKLPGLVIIQQAFRDIASAGGVSLRAVEGNEPRRLAWLEGAVTFWGTERCYLDAWSWAKANEPESKDVRDDADGGALRKEFIPNWSSEGFREFVEGLGRLIDEAVGKELERVEGDEERESVKGEILERVEEKWKTLLEGERAFWPEI